MLREQRKRKKWLQNASKRRGKEKLEHCSETNATGHSEQRSRKVGKETILILKTLDDHNGDDAADNDVEDDVQCS